MQLFEMPIIWIRWVTFGLFILIMMINIIQPHAIITSIRVIATPIQRRYSSGNNLPFMAGLRTIFVLGVMSLNLLLATNSCMNNTISVSMQHFLMATLMLAGTGLIKIILDKWIQLTFRFSISVNAYKDFRNDLNLAQSALLWLVLLIHPWLNATASWVIPCVVITIYGSIIWWKTIQLFGWNIQHIVFTMLYVLHMEILPLAIVVVGMTKLLN